MEALERMKTKPSLTFVDHAEETASTPKSLIVDQEFVPRAPDSLKANPRNARLHSKRQIRQLGKSIKAAGFIGAIIIDENRMILAGHARNEAAKLIGLELVPTIRVTGLSEAQKRAFVLADNKIAENAGWDREILATELGELSELLPTLNWDLTVTGFEPAEVDLLLADHGEPKPDPADSLPAILANAVTRSGDMWSLGPHRLVCGDARSSADLDLLLGDRQAHMMFADPPYEVRVADVQGRGRIKHPEVACTSGDMSLQEYIAFLVETLGNAARVSIDGAVHFVCIDWRHIAELIGAGRAVYDAMLALCIWAKSNAGRGPFYRSQHELIGVFRVGTGEHQNNLKLGRFRRNRSNLWSYAGINSGKGRMETLARHPITMIADAMRDCTAKGDIVLDPFVGLGSTILAAEKIGRRGYALELEPHYVDVAIRRWESYTELEAILEGDGRTFSQIEADRLENPVTTPDPTRAHGPDEGRQPETDEDYDNNWVGLCGEAPDRTPRGGGK
jgi:DNA modification methylase